MAVKSVEEWGWEDVVWEWHQHYSTKQRSCQSMFRKDEAND